MEFCQGLLDKRGELAGANVGLDLLVPKLGFLLTEPPAELKNLGRRELLDLTDDLCGTH